MNSAAISVLAEAGLHGHEAESALRHVLSELASPSERSREVLAEMGLRPADIDCSMRRNVTIFRLLADSGLDRARAAALFGTGADAALMLVQNIERLEEFDA